MKLLSDRYLFRRNLTPDEIIRIQAEILTQEDEILAIDKETETLVRICLE